MIKMTKASKYDIKIAIAGTLSILAYFILPYLEVLPFALLGIDTATLPNITKAIYMFAYEVITLAIIMYLLREQLKKQWNDLKKNHRTYFKKYFKYWFLMLGLMMLSNLIILMIEPQSTAGNEELIRSIFSEMPIYMYLSAVVIAPLMEELVFRLSIRNIFPHTDWLFIIVSGLIFGGMHVIGNVNTWIDILYLIPYSIPGFVFAYVLTKSNNVFVGSGLHFVHNGVLMSLQVLVLLFG